MQGKKKNDIPQRIIVVIATSGKNMKRLTPHAFSNPFHWWKKKPLSIKAKGQFTDNIIATRMLNIFSIMCQFQLLGEIVNKCAHFWLVFCTLEYRESVQSSKHFTSKFSRFGPAWVRKQHFWNHVCVRVCVWERECVCGLHEF